LLVVAAPGKEQEAILRLARVGYENVVGFLEGGIDAWKKAGMPIDTVTSVNPDEFAADVKSGKSKREIIDVRRPGEYDAGHVKGAELFCLTNFSDEKNLEKFSPEEPYYLHCAGGYRSVIATSILKAKGFTNIVNVRKGWNGIKSQDLPLELPELA